MFMIAAVPVACTLLLLFLDSRFHIGNDDGGENKDEGHPVNEPGE